MTNERIAERQKKLDSWLIQLKALPIEELESELSPILVPRAFDIEINDLINHLSCESKFSDNKFIDMLIYKYENLIKNVSYIKSAKKQAQVEGLLLELVSDLKKIPANVIYSEDIIPLIIKYKNID